MLYSTVICLLFHKEAVSGTLCHFFLHCNVALIFMLCESGFLTLLGGRKVCPHFRNSGSLFQFVSGGGGAGSCRHQLGVRNSEVSARREFSHQFKAFNRSPLICPDNKGRRDKLFRKWSITTVPCQCSCHFSLRKTINTTNKSSFFLAHGRRNWQLSGTAILVAKMFFYSPWQSKQHVTSCYICRNMATPGQIMEKEYPKIFLVTRKCLHFLRGMIYGQPAP